MIWQKRVRALLGVLVLLLGAGVTWYVTRQRTEAAPAPLSPRTDDNADIEISGNEDIRTDAAGNVIFRLKYDHGFIYSQQGRVRLVNVTGLLPRGGKPIHFKADQVEMKLKSGNTSDFASFDDMKMRGNVLIKSGPGAEVLHFESSEVDYSELTGIMTTDKPAKMKKGNMSGSGTGATLDRNRSVMWLLANSKVSLKTAQGTTNVTSARAGLAEVEKYMRFEENVRMGREGRVIETDAAVANLTPDGNGITGLELRGNSRITGGGSGGGMPNMRADDITITYGAETALLERAVLMRNARIDLPEGGGRSLAAGYIDIGFGGDGNTVTVLDANEAVELRIPADGNEPAREVDAARLEARGAVPHGLERAQFTGGVEFREQAAAKGKQPAVDRLGTSETLTLGLDGGFGKIKDADFTGKFTFRDADVNAEAPEAKYSVDRKYIELRGGSTVARVVQTDGTVEAKEIDLTLDPRKMAARGAVKNTLKPGARKDRKEPRPSLLEDDEPVFVTAARLDYDGAAGRATYTGDVRLSQGGTVIQGETIILDDKTGNLEARKKPGAALQVRTLFLIREEPAAGGKPASPARPTQGSADELIYDESRRQAMYRGSARLAGPDGNIRGERIDLFLEEDGNTLDRAEAFEKVKADLGDGRNAAGDRLTYNAKTRRYEMRGKPLVVEQKRDDKGQTRCERTTGASLTFDRSADTFVVLGVSGAPTRAVPFACNAKLP